MRHDTLAIESRDNAVSMTGESMGKGAPADAVGESTGAPVKPTEVVLPMALYAERHRGQDGTAVVCPVCVEKVWYADSAYGYMKLTDYIEAHRDHTRPPLLEVKP